MYKKQSLTPTNYARKWLVEVLQNTKSGRIIAVF